MTPEDIDWRDVQEDVPLEDGTLLRCRTIAAVLPDYVYALGVPVDAPDWQVTFVKHVIVKRFRKDGRVE